MTRLMALDLSLTATGVFVGDPEDPKASYTLSQITTPARRLRESDSSWNSRRFKLFMDALLDLVRDHHPDLLVTEITSHAHTITTRGAGANATKQATTRGMEFRAGLGLGRAIGWLDAVLYLASVYGFPPMQVETIEAKDAKLRVAGARAASKDAVRHHLKMVYGWPTDAWKESQVDALAAGLGWVRTRDQQAIEARILAIGEAQYPTKKAR